MSKTKRNPGKRQTQQRNPMRIDGVKTPLDKMKRPRIDKVKTPLDKIRKPLIKKVKTPLNRIKTLM